MRNRRRHVLAAVALTLGAAAGGVVVSGQSRGPEDDGSRSLVGSYLAGRFARTQQDSDKAAIFYRNALVRDPGNEVLIEQAFVMELTEGHWPRATQLAEELAAKQPTHRFARMFLGLSEFKGGNFKKADEHFVAAATGPIGELTSALARAWIKLAQHDADGALALLDVPKQAEWAQFYLRYHRALIADIASRRAEARTAYERVFKQDNRTLRTALAYAQHAANSGDMKLARSILKDHLDRGQGEGHPLARALRDRLQDGAKIDMLINDATEGLAEVFYGLGEALTGEGGVSVGIVHLQMALFLEPNHAFALAALANALETSKKYVEAIEVYDRIPKGSPLESSIEIRKAFNLNSLERVDEAKDVLDRLLTADPTDLKVIDALGNIMRSRKRYAEAAEYYSRAISQITKPEKRHWTYYYARGTSYERLKRWPAAEVDLQKALQLYPDQPLVLNYLGYSWIDQGRNLKQGMGLIEKAVALKPDDGYIVDSLGWAHFKQGNFREAVRYLERAVELRPEDPVLNDHLGDALWRVGREREARFQWEQALTLQPEPEDAEKIKRKVAKGLASLAQPRVVPKRPREARGVDVRKRVETKLVPTRPILE